MLRRLALTVSPLVLLVLVLGACAEPVRLPPAEPAASEQPLFATDEEALAAATAAYEEYLAVSNAILRDGGQEPERLAGMVSDEVFTVENEGYLILRENEWRATGGILLSNVVLQQVIQYGDGTAEIVAYVCASVEGTDIVDAEGESQVDPSREPFLAHEVVFRFSDLDQFAIDEKKQWDVGSVCG